MNPVTHFWLKPGKVRELEFQKDRESQGTLLKKLGGNPVIVTFYLTKTENRTKKSLTQLSYYCFESRYYFDKKC